MKRSILFAALSILAAPAASATVITYDVVTTFYEPDTQPYDTIFMGSFQYDDATQTVSNLRGTLSESMTGNTSWIALEVQLSSVYDAGLGGLLVTSFRNGNTNTLTTMFGGDGWTPGSDAGSGLYYDFPNANPANAYVRIFVPTPNPLAPLTQAQIDKLAYADCADGGMMGATCMTGTTVAGYGYVGTMSGYPVSQTITFVVPEPGSMALVSLGIGLLGLCTRQRADA
ncbi:hypothetical protein MYXO_03457 [Myxococcaceae bacterium]|jgi:hypothetical protein|nr:hypothetical protein MYXO_03457 [Myxococcaceae bacterium]